MGNDQLTASLSASAPSHQPHALGRMVVGISRRGETP